MEGSRLNTKATQENRSRSEPRHVSPSIETRETRNSKNRTRSCNPSRNSGQSSDANSYSGSNSSAVLSRSICSNQISSSCKDSRIHHKDSNSSHHGQLQVNEPSNTNIEFPVRKNSNMIRISRKSLGNRCVLEQIEDTITKQDKENVPDVNVNEKSSPSMKRPSSKIKSSKTNLKDPKDSASNNDKREVRRMHNTSTTNTSSTAVCHCASLSKTSKTESRNKNSSRNNRTVPLIENSRKTSRSRSLSVGRTKQVSFSPSSEETSFQPNSGQSSRTFSKDGGVNFVENVNLSNASSICSSNTTTTSKLSQFLSYINTFRSSSPAAPQRRVGHEYLMTNVDDSIYEHIFSYLSHKEIQKCSYVCKLWMKIVMPKLGGIVVFNGRSFLWSSKSRNMKRIEKFLARIRYKEEKFRHPCKIKFMNSKDEQMKYLIGTEYSDILRLSVRHMTHINFNNCRVKWSTFVDLLLHFENLKVLIDEHSYHYSFQSRLFRLPESQTHISKTVGRNLLHENGLAKVKSVRITRNNFDQEIINYIFLLRATIYNLHEFSLVIIEPNDKSRSINPLYAAANDRDMAEFTINLRLFLISQGRHLKKIVFKWNNEIYTDLFAKCMETLKLQNRFYGLSELTLVFERNSMKTPKNLDILLTFLQIHCAKALRIFRFSVIVLGTHWNETIEQMEMLIQQKSFTTNFELGVELCDGFGQSVTKANKKVIGLSLFVAFTTHLKIYVENHTTSSIKEMIPRESSKQYLRLKKLHVQFEIGKPFPKFKDFKFDIIAHNFPNLYELFIEDEVGGENDLGSGAVIGDAEIQLISAVLVKLRVLRLWTNLENLTDYGITGICPEEICSLKTKRARSSNDVEHDLRSSFSSLSDIRELSLRGVGTGVTSISARFGFDNLPKLKYLEIIGAHKISRSGKKALQKKLRSSNSESILKLS